MTRTTTYSVKRHSSCVSHVGRACMHACLSPFYAKHLENYGIEMGVGYYCGTI